ncbi:MAG: hypothetical protein Q7R87_00175 [Nanoarchaeota archaeon]|nr:hypothetical protein [Nanoarchaeota archaeon]
MEEEVNQKRSHKHLILGIVLVVVFFIGAFLYFALVGVDYSSRYNDYEKSGQLVNPTLKLSTEEAVDNFNEDFVYYMLYQIGFYNLRENALTGDKPRILIYADEDFYSAEINKGEIIVSKEKIGNPDVIIWTSKLEGVLMLQDSNYVVKSFNEGKSKIELVADKSSLFSKGYLKIYSKLTGKSVTGNIIRIYSG